MGTSWDDHQQNPKPEDSIDQLFNKLVFNFTKSSCWIFCFVLIQAKESAEKFQTNQFLYDFVSLDITSFEYALCLHAYQKADGN